MCEALRELFQGEFLETRIRVTVETMIEDRKNDSEIIQRLMSKFELSEDDARKALESHRKTT